MEDGESLKCCKLSLTGNSGKCSEDYTADRKIDSKGQAHRFQMEMSTVLGIGLKVIYITF